MSARGDASAAGSSPIHFPWISVSLRANPGRSHKKLHNHLRDQRNVSPHTLRNYVSDLAQLRQFLVESDLCLSGPDIVDVGKIDIYVVRAFLASLSKDRKKSSIGRKLAAFKVFFGYLPAFDRDAQAEGASGTLVTKWPSSQKMQIRSLIEQTGSIYRMCQGRNLPNSVPKFRFWQFVDSRIESIWRAVEVGRSALSNFCLDFYWAAIS